MKNIIIFFVLYILSLNVFSQDNYYWSGSGKLELEIDSTRILAYVRDPFEIIDKVLSTSDQINSVTEIPVGKRKPLEIKIVDKTSFKDIRNIISDMLEIDFVVPVYHLDGYYLYLTNQIILRPRIGISNQDILNLAGPGIKLIENSDYNSQLWEVEMPRDMLKLSNLIYESGIVEWCEPNFRGEITADFIPNDPMFPDQYYLRNTGQLGGVSGIDIKAYSAWDLTYGCNNIRVVVIDQGCEDHDDLAGRVLQGFTPRTGGNGAPIGTGNGHGVSCSGIIAASHNSVGVSGVAPNSQIIGVNIFSGGETYNDIANGINWAWDPLNGDADVISNSWGYPTTAILSNAIVQAITNARTNGRVRNGAVRGCPVVFASGNSNQQFQGVTFPANVNGVITVGGITNRGILWAYSSRGPEMDFVAPTGNTNLNGDVRTTDRMGTNGYETGNYTTRFGGTSAACPQVSGVVALMQSINPNLTENQIRTILQQTATDMGASGFDNDYGYGRVHARNALDRVLSDLNTNISGPALLCTNGTFNLNNYPFGNTSWSVTPSYLVSPSSGTGNVANITKLGNGNPTITFNLGCGGSGLSYQFHTGPYSSSDYPITGPSSALCNSTVTYTIPTLAGATSINWTWSPSVGWSYISGQGTTTLRLMTGPQYGNTIAVGVNNTCGQSGSYATKYTSIYGSCGYFMYTIFPNPASDELIIELTDPDTEEFVVFEELSIDQISIMNNNMELVLLKTFDSINIRRVELDIRNIERGIVYLKVKVGDYEFTERVVIDK